MRKIDELARDHFDGDVRKALRYIMEHADFGPFSDYEDELTPEEAIWVLNQAWEILIDTFGSEENLNVVVKLQDTLESLHLTEKEVENAHRNPYTVQLLKNVFKLQAIIVGVVALTRFGLEQGHAEFICSVASGVISCTIAGNIIHSIKFRKAKKLIQKKRTFYQEAPEDSTV